MVSFIIHSTCTHKHPIVRSHMCNHISVICDLGKADYIPNCSVSLLFCMSYSTDLEIFSLSFDCERSFVIKVCSVAVTQTKFEKPVLFLFASFKTLKLQFD